MAKAVGLVFMACVMAAALVGCEATAQSDRTEPGWQTTPSYDYIMSAKVAPAHAVRPRHWPESDAVYEAPVVTHFGSYYDDPFVTNGDGDDALGWTLMDPLAVIYSPARFVVNTVALPVSMVKEPPCVLQVTDLDQPISECGIHNPEKPN